MINIIIAKCDLTQLEPLPNVVKVTGIIILTSDILHRRETVYFNDLKMYACYKVSPLLVSDGNFTL